MARACLAREIIAVLVFTLCIVKATSQSVLGAPPYSILSAPTECTAVRDSITWGAATSAYQIEGAWNVDGKSPSIWDTLTAKPDLIADNTTGKVAIDSYHRWAEDIALMQALGMRNYRFSIAWTRIVPGGVAGSPVNAAGVAWYRRFIKALLAAGIKPAVTIYHWDLPQVLQDKYGGFMSPLIARDFLYYAEVLFRELGDLVDSWMTFNEVISICELGYALPLFAPRFNGGQKARWICSHNLINAHAQTVQLYRERFAPSQKGRISIVLDGKWGYPRDPNNPADVAAAEAYVVWQYAHIADPIYFGRYPQAMRDALGDALPRFTDKESALLRNTTPDFFSFNFYCGHYVWAPAPGSPKDVVYTLTGSDGKLTSPGVPTNAVWLFKTPDAFRKILVWLSKRYNSPEIWVTENGVSVPNEESEPLPKVLNDTFRQDYFKTYLDSMCLAKTVDGVKVTHYYAWSIFDNFEWRDGFSKRFGAVYIDLERNLTRSAKGTAYWLSKYVFRPAAVSQSPGNVTAAAPGTAAAGGANAGATGSLLQRVRQVAVSPLNGLASLLGLRRQN